MYFKYDAKAEQECSVFLNCEHCQTNTRIGTKPYELTCPECKNIRRYAYYCTKCNRKYFPSAFTPKICRKCHPELIMKNLPVQKTETIDWGNLFENSENTTDFGNPSYTPVTPAPAPQRPLTPKEQLEKRIHEAKVTYLSDEPSGAFFDRALYDEWHSKLDPAHLERLQNDGRDPYDIWR